MIFKCNYCSYSSPLAKTVQIHLRKHSSKRQIAINGIKSTQRNDQKKDQTVVVESGKEQSSFDSETALEKPIITRIYGCGLCDLLSPTFSAALVHSVEHRTLIISLERMIIC